MKTYAIKKGYEINQINMSVEDSENKYFWNLWNTFIARKAQYYVYQIAYDLAIKHHINTVLDVGCGIGVQLKRFFGKKFQVYGIDQPSGIKACKIKMPEGTFLVENIAIPKHTMKTFIKTSPLIICADVIEHFDDPDHVLDYIKAYCSKDTLIVLSTPERDSIAGKNNNKPENPYHVREWAFKEFQEYLTQANFKILQHTIVKPGQFCFDPGTAFYIFQKRMSGLPLEHTQVVVCQLNDL
jgi:SAM-dependent methyltransferase